MQVNVVFFKRKCWSVKCILVLAAVQWCIVIETYESKMLFFFYKNMSFFMILYLYFWVFEEMRHWNYPWKHFAKSHFWLVIHLDIINNNKCLLQNYLDMESIISMHLKIRRTAMAVARMTITATKTAITATYGVFDSCDDPRKHKNWFR